MNKYEIETAIIEELKNFMPSIKNVPFDKGLPLMQREAWRLADKYDTDGANVINIMMKRFEEYFMLQAVLYFKWVLQAHATYL